MQRSRRVNAAITLSGRRKHADFAICGRYVDAERTQGKRAADICSRTVDADWAQTRHGLNADYVYTDDWWLVSVSKSDPGLVCVRSASSLRSPPGCECLLRACPVFALRPRSVHIARSACILCPVSVDAAFTLRSCCVHAAFTLRSLDFL